MGFLAPVGAALGGTAFGGGLGGLLTQAATSGLIGGGVNSLLGGDFGDGALKGAGLGILGNSMVGKGLQNLLGSTGADTALGVGGGVLNAATTPDTTSVGPGIDLAPPTAASPTSVDLPDPTLQNAVPETPIIPNPFINQEPVVQPGADVTALSENDALAEIIASLGEFIPIPDINNPTPQLIPQF